MIYFILTQWFFVAKLWNLALWQNLVTFFLQNIIEPTFSSKSHKKSDFYAISKTELLSAMDLLQGSAACKKMKFFNSFITSKR
jgi:hypothetical protein